MRARARWDDDGIILRSFARERGLEGGRGRAREGRRLDEVDGYGRARGGEGLEARDARRRTTRGGRETRETRD